MPTSHLVRDLRQNGFAYLRVALLFIVAYLAVWALILIAASGLAGAPGEGQTRPQDYLVGAVAALAPIAGVLAGRAALDQTLRSWNGWAAFVGLGLINLADLVMGLGDVFAPGAVFWPLFFWALGLCVSLAAGYWFLIRARR